MQNLKIARNSRGILITEEKWAAVERKKRVRFCNDVKIIEMDTKNSGDEIANTTKPGGSDARDLNTGKGKVDTKSLSSGAKKRGARKRKKKRSDAGKVPDESEVISRILKKFAQAAAKRGVSRSESGGSAKASETPKVFEEQKRKFEEDVSKNFRGKVSGDPNNEVSSGPTEGPASISTERSKGCLEEVSKGFSSKILSGSSNNEVSGGSTGDPASVSTEAPDTFGGAEIKKVEEKFSSVSNNEGSKSSTKVSSVSNNNLFGFSLECHEGTFGFSLGYHEDTEVVLDCYENTEVVLGCHEDTDLGKDKSRTQRERTNHEHTECWGRRLGASSKFRSTNFRRT